MEKQKQKVALVTGGTKGIGFGVAQSLLQQGYKVAVTGRSQSTADEAADKLKVFGDAIGIAADVKSLESQTATVQTVLDKWGQLDVLIANAGVGHFAPIDELSADQWHDTIDTNLTGVFFSIKAALDALKISKGYIITISSLAGTNFFAGASAYNASKFGLTGFSQAAMLDLRKYDIKVTTIMPGSVATYFAEHEPDAEKDAWKIQPEDIGQMVVDLLNMPARTLPSKVEVRPLKTSN
ncbi:MAG TPA: SDR family oxidoreductase [Pedobacter sp.]|nr:SDR family oxidoreductase [Pedobacter sp.]